MAAGEPTGDAEARGAQVAKALDRIPVRWTTAERTGGSCLETTVPSLSSMIFTKQTRLFLNIFVIPVGTGPAKISPATTARPRDFFTFCHNLYPAETPKNRSVLNSFSKSC